MTELTIRQAQCLSTIRRLTCARGLPPTFELIRQDLDLSSKAGVHRLVHGLKDAGYLRVKHRGGHHPAIEIVGEPLPVAMLEELDAEALRKTAAHIAGILAERDGVAETAIVYHRIADRLPRQSRAA